MYRRYQSIWGILIVLVLWQIFSMLASVPFLPDPISVLAAFNKLLKGELLLHLGMSFLRVFIGLLMASIAAIPLGLMTGRMERLDRFLAPVLYFLYPIPKIAFLPLVMLTFGIGNVSAVFMIILVIFFQIFISARDGVKTISNEYFYVMISLGSSTLKVYYHVILPGTLPKIFSALRVGLGTALSVLFFTETQAVGSYGIGYFIFDAMLRVQYREMFTGIVAIGILGWLLFKLLDMAENYLCPWLKNS